MPSQGEGDQDALLDAVGTAFSRLRRRTTEIDVGPAVTRKDHTRILVINLIENADDEVTVGAVGEHLGIDASVASRMVSDCISAGLVARTASQRDGRRIVLQLTAAGVELGDRFRDKYRQTFEHITRDWTQHDRLELVRLLLRYVAAGDALRSRG